jgi:hypothetical protein
MEHTGTKGEIDFCINYQPAAERAGVCLLHKEDRSPLDSAVFFVFML